LPQFLRVKAQTTIQAEAHSQLSIQEAQTEARSHNSTFKAPKTVLLKIPIFCDVTLSPDLFPDVEESLLEISGDTNQSTQGHNRQAPNPHIHQVSNYHPNYPFANQFFKHSGLTRQVTKLLRAQLSTAAYIYIYIYMCVCVCVCVYIYIYSYIHVYYIYSREIVLTP
jgi:hypothetical protein